MDENTKTCALVAASDFNSQHFIAQCKSSAFDQVIAVDGGFAHLESTGFAASVCIGDFDSLGYVPSGVHIIQHPVHKDQSDLELALEYCVNEGFSRVVIYGALGRRLDHAIAGLQVCARFAEAGMSVELVGLDCIVSVLVGPGTLELPARERGTVSVFSAVDESRGVTERGLEYPLENATLTNRTTLGLSNEMVGQPAAISVETGTLLIFHQGE